MQRSGIPLVYHCLLSWKDDKVANGSHPPSLFRRCCFGWRDSGLIACPSHAEMVLMSLWFIIVQLPLFMVKPYVNQIQSPRTPGLPPH